MKNSIKLRLVLVLMGLLGFMIAVISIMNVFFLEKYYKNYKVKMLGNTYNEVKETYSDDMKEESILKLEQLISKENVSLYIFRSYQYSLGNFLEIIFPSGMSEKQTRIIETDILYNYTKEDLFYDNNVIYKDKEYYIFKHFNARLETNYMELFGALDDGTRIYIRTNYDNIMESVNIANRFFMYIGLIVAGLGAIIMYFIGVNFTKPIRKLSEITKEISELNFNVKYEEKRMDEVGDLGRAVNLLSEKLEAAISELKFANNELKNDIRQKESEDALRKEFLSNITHEFKTPIALIRGYAEGLKENVNEAEEDKDFYCDVIIDEANKMNIMVKKLLSLNQIELGMSKPEFERFDVTALIRSVVQSMDMLFKGENAVCYFEVKEPVYVWADEFLVEEVITNYITNAIHHVEEDGNGKKIISITSKCFEDKVKISVFNTGRPIPEEDVLRLWEKFYKVDKARTREYGGSGIGLSIVKAIMESLNREYGLKNWDNGVEFWFELDIKA